MQKHDEHHNEMHHNHGEKHQEGEGALIEYVKLAGIILGIGILSLWHSSLTEITAMNYMRSFMGVFFVVFALFKLLDLRGFASSYIGYDIIAKRFANYAYAYPFIEFALGLGYLFTSNPYLDWITLGVMSVGAIGVFRELLRKSNIKCACLGTYVKLPLTTVSVMEDVSMAAMALWFIIK